MDIIEIDEQVLLALNGWHNEFFDTLMWYISTKWLWIPLYVAMAVVIMMRNKLVLGLLCLVMIGLLIVCTDQLCGSVCRSFFARMRPANPDNPISGLVHVVNGYRGGKYGFPSCHAANTFAWAAFMMLYLRSRVSYFLFPIYSLLVCYSRIYLGVHYPGDILVGMLVGGTFGGTFYYLYLRLSLYLTARFGLRTA